MTGVDIDTERVDDVPLLIRLTQPIMGMPLTTLVLPGNRDNDGLYVPAIQRARPVVGQRGRLYTGDSKMAVLDTRAFLQHGGDDYLVPLPMTGEVPGLLETLLKSVEQVHYVVQVNRNSAAIREARRLMGRRLYAITAPQEQVSLTKAVRVYRGAPRIERDFRRLKGCPLGIRPLYVQRDDHARGMVRLLSLALRVLTPVEYVVRERLRTVRETLKGLYAGNPQRQTAHPTTERLLKAFKGITLTVVRLPEQAIRHVTPLSDLQRRILTLLGLPCSIYETLAVSADPIPP